MTTYYSLVIFVPTTHGRAIRDALAASGAGSIGNYDSCSFSVVGVGRFRPLKGANPTIGKVGTQEVVAEERIETDVHRDRITEVLKAVRAAHPYEQPGIHVTHLIDLAGLERGGGGLPRDDQLKDLYARVSAVEETVRETLAGLASDIALWQTAAKAQIDAVHAAAAAQTRRRRDAHTAGSSGLAGSSSPTNSSMLMGRTESSLSLSLDSRNNTGDGHESTLLRPTANTPPLRALEKRLVKSEDLLSEHDRLFRVMVAGQQEQQQQVHVAGGTMPKLSLVAQRPYSAPIKELDKRLKGVEALIGNVHEALSEQTAVLEDHALSLQVLQRPTGDGNASGSQLPDGNAAADGFV